MPKLPAPATHPDRPATLRGRAAARLKGPAATLGANARAFGALTVLHALASSPRTASDALALLHELQVHQVELDLQAQELREARAELEAALRRQIELYDHQPACAFTLDAQLRVQELNQRGAALLGLARDEAYGLPLDTCFGEESAQRLRAMVAAVLAPAAPGGGTACALTLRPQDGTAQTVWAQLAPDTVAGRCLLSLLVAG